MPNSSQPYQFDGLADRSNWVRMRTLALLRGMAIAGQLAAIFIAWRFFQIAINPFLCLSIVGLSVLANIVSSVRYPQNRRLSETEALATLRASFYLTKPKKVSCSTANCGRAKRNRLKVYLHP